MSIFSQRSHDFEIMDDLNCRGEVVDQTLRELEFINRTLGGNQITISGVNSLIKTSTVIAREEQRPKQSSKQNGDCLAITHNDENAFEIVDLGCGGGDMLALLSNHLSKRKIKANFLGIDANPNIIEYAKKNTIKFGNIQFEAIDIISKEFESRHFDIAIATLFFHHFSSEQLSEILKKLYAQCKVGIVINDLHRHPLAYYSIKWLTQLFSKSAMVKFDAPLSVLRGFSKKEIEKILAGANITNYSVRWCWAFRWEVVIKKVGRLK